MLVRRIYTHLLHRRTFLRIGIFASLLCSAMGCGDTGHGGDENYWIYYARYETDKIDTTLWIPPAGKDGVAEFRVVRLSNGTGNVVEGVLTADELTRMRAVTTVDRIQAMLAAHDPSVGQNSSVEHPYAYVKLYPAEDTEGPLGLDGIVKLPAQDAITAEAFAVFDDLIAAHMAK